MADKSRIEWTDATWNPIRGCSVVSAGCRNCYAMQVAARFSGKGYPYESLAYRNESGAHWTGKVKLIEEHIADPLRWKRPRRIFVNSMSDLFHESIPDEWIDRIFAVMALAPQHVFQVLTKRPERMLRYMTALSGDRLLRVAFESGLLTPRAEDVEAYAGIIRGESWPLANIHLGVSVEDQPNADKRREHLRAIATQGWMTWVSYEPALGPVIWDGWEFIKWLVPGGESGPGARPAHPEWFRTSRDWAIRNLIAFLFKQWGEYSPVEPITLDAELADCELSKTFAIHIDGSIGWQDELDPAWSKLKPFAMERIGKKAAGRLLDGREWNEYPSEISNLKSQIAEVRA